MRLLSLHSVTRTEHDGVYIANVTIEVDGQVKVVDYSVDPRDPYGIGADVFAAVKGHIEKGGTIRDYTPLTHEELRAGMRDLTARQFRLGIISSGRSLEGVVHAISSISDHMVRDAAMVEWEFASSFSRLHPLVVSLSSVMGMSPEEVDVLWKTAAEL